MRGMIHWKACLIKMQCLSPFQLFMHKVCTYYCHFSSTHRLAVTKMNAKMCIVTLHQEKTPSAVTQFDNLHPNMVKGNFQISSQVALVIAITFYSKLDD